MAGPTPNSKGWLVRLKQLMITLTLAPGRLMLFVSNTLLLRPSISPSGAWLCDVKRQETATSVREGMEILLIVCTWLAISHPNRSVHTSSRSSIVTTGRIKSFSYI